MDDRSLNGKQFGAHIKKQLRTDEAFGILDSHPETHGSDWSAGGCRIAATALHRILPGSTLQAVWDAEGHEPQHYAVHHEGTYYDDQGAQSHDQFIKNWTDPHGHLGVPNPVLRPTSEEEMGSFHSIPDPVHESGEKSSDILSRYLTQGGSG